MNLNIVGMIFVAIIAFLLITSDDDMGQGLIIGLIIALIPITGWWLILKMLRSSSASVLNVMVVMSVVFLKVAALLFFVIFSRWVVAGMILGLMLSLKTVTFFNNDAH